MALVCDQMGTVGSISMQRWSAVLITREVEIKIGRAAIARPKWNMGLSEQQGALVRQKSLPRLQQLTSGEPKCSLSQPLLEPCLRKQLEMWAVLFTL